MQFNIGLAVVLALNQFIENVNCNVDNVYHSTDVRLTNPTFALVVEELINATIAQIVDEPELNISANEVITQLINIVIICLLRTFLYKLLQVVTL